METTWQPPAHDLVRHHTSEASNRRIDLQTQAEIDEVIDNEESVRERLLELDHEWDVDRALMVTFAFLGGATAALAMRNIARTRRIGGWGGLFFTQVAFLAHHAIRGWCPPMPVLRRLGFRSKHEIAAERVMLEKQLDRIER